MNVRGLNLRDVYGSIYIPLFVNNIHCSQSLSVFELRFIHY